MLKSDLNYRIIKSPDTVKDGDLSGIRDSSVNRKRRCRSDRTCKRFQRNSKDSPFLPQKF